MLRVITSMLRNFHVLSNDIPEIIVHQEVLLSFINILKHD
jgi:hypothetical protein